VNNPEIEIKGSFNLEYIRLICTKNGTELKFLPNSRALSTDEYYQQFARSYSQQELIGKTSLKPDLSLLTPLLKGKSVLITGAGGSIGSELARQVFQCAPKKLFLLDRDETKLLELELSFQKYRLDTKIELILADIREEQNIGFILKYIKPDIIFHAAALKHLNMLEKYPLEAYKTNVIGTYNLLRNSIENNCSIFVNISSDKASDPISVLGLSKLYSEKLVSSFANIHSNQKILSVRFGNVFGSQGSFIHTFKQQIIDGGPITITHPKVARYFMTLQEAVFLVVQAAVVGESGQTLLLTMGEQILIQDIATKLIKNSGKKIEIIYTGLNHGEKLDETLIGKNEKIISKYDKNIFAIKIPSKNLSEIYFEWKNESIVTNLRHLCEVNMYQSFGHQN
jgi:dTDP-glucose 4,6-dehydratase